MAGPAIPFMQMIMQRIPGLLGGMSRAPAAAAKRGSLASKNWQLGGKTPAPFVRDGITPMLAGVPLAMGAFPVGIDGSPAAPPQQSVSPFDALDRHLGVRAYEARPLTIRGAAPDSSYDTGDAGGILETTTPDINRGAGAPRAGATGADAPLPPPRPSEEEIKKLIAMQAYANNYQSNSLPVLNEGKINWGTDAAGYDGGDSYGGNAADFFRADALRMAVPGLLGM